MTQATKQSEITRNWHIIDANEKILGRMAVDVAYLLMGKTKPYFVRNLDCGDYVIVINAQTVSVKGKKEEQKKYYRHSGFPGGFKSETVRQLRSRKPEDIITHAVRGMLPQNKLRDSMLKRLYVFAGEEHPYKDKVK